MLKRFHHLPNFFMFFVSNVFPDSPKEFKTPLQEKTYQALEELQISFQRVDTDEAITMEDCMQIDAKLNMKIIFYFGRQELLFSKLLPEPERLREQFILCVFPQQSYHSFVKSRTILSRIKSVSI